MSTTTYDEVVELLGDIDDLLTERIVATGATTAELAEALDYLEDERQCGAPRQLDVSPRVALIRSILDELFDADDEDSWSIAGATP